MGREAVEEELSAVSCGVRAVRGGGLRAVWAGEGGGGGCGGEGSAMVKRARLPENGKDGMVADAHEHAQHTQRTVETRRSTAQGSNAVQLLREEERGTEVEAMQEEEQASGLCQQPPSARATAEDAGGIERLRCCGARRRRQRRRIGRGRRRQQGSRGCARPSCQPADEQRGGGAQKARLGAAAGRAEVAAGEAGRERVGEVRVELVEGGLAASADVCAVSVVWM